MVKMYERRVMPEDIVTIGLILKAAKAIKTNYGLIINKIEDDDADEILANPSGKRQFLAIYEEALPHWCGDANVMFLKKHPELTGASDKYISPEELKDPHGTTLKKFWMNLPSVQIEKGSVNRPMVGLFRHFLEKITAFTSAVFEKITDIIKAEGIKSFSYENNSIFYKFFSIDSHSVIY